LLLENQKNNPDFFSVLQRRRLGARDEVFDVKSGAKGKTRDGVEFADL
jgi:hypothetical protein